jgi:trimeric autotransporter adhesin
VNVSGAADIGGNDQAPVDWGPPALVFSSGIAVLTDAQSAFNRSRTDNFSASTMIYRGRHNITIGGDFRKQQYNDFFQQDPRGTFTFTGAATSGESGSVATSGSDLADFLIGVPDTSAIAFGNADKYLRQPVYDAYATDDWRILPTLTINAGVRWEYGAPITELRGRLVNLDLAPDFTAAAPVLANDPVGPVTGIHYPSSLVRPDPLGVEPRIGVSWRPIPASTIVVRAGYGIYHDTSVYQNSALQLAQQAPLSKSLSVQNSTACALTLANGFNPCSSITADTFAIDPNFRVGYAQTWQLAVQRDLPAALQLAATYFGVKGTRGVQEFLPNTYPIGAANLCPSCPSGFAYRTSGGDSTRESGQLQLRRRLRSGFTASLLYTFSKSIDDDATLGGQGYQTTTQQNQNLIQATPPPTIAIAQNWRDLRAERALSTFDQRHLLNLQAQYTSGEGLGGGDLLNGWAGRLLKEWTMLAQINTGTGLPESPIYLAAVPGAGFSGTIRPNRTGAPLYTSGSGLHLNSAAYTAPLAGQWGTAARDSITGPGQFSLDSSLARTFRPGTRFFLDARVDATNLLNHAAFTSWNSTVNNAQFGVPVGVNPMRSLQITLRLRF